MQKTTFDLNFSGKALKRYLHPSKEISKLQTKITSEKKKYKNQKKLIGAANYLKSAAGRKRAAVIKR